MTMAQDHAISWLFKRPSHATGKSQSKMDDEMGYPDDETETTKYVLQ